MSCTRTKLSFYRPALCFIADILSTVGKEKFNYPGIRIEVRICNYRQSHILKYLLFKNRGLYNLSKAMEMHGPAAEPVIWLLDHISSGEQWIVYG